MLGVHLQCSQEAFNGLLKPALAQVQKPQIAIPCGVVWIGFQTASQLRNGSLELPRSKQPHRSVIGLNGGDMRLQRRKPLRGIGQTSCRDRCKQGRVLRLG